MLDRVQIAELLTLHAQAYELLMWLGEDAVTAILEYLTRHGLELCGAEVVDIGSWNGHASHALSVRLSPLQIKSAPNPRMTLEQFRQETKCLAVWEYEE